ncbi:aspartyl-phosphate phosphatase Spo0E family protein [Paenibacillus pabuli]|uniref:aspartyl-phosphate phosphatase Spo0E family protein n=1 Tax=Paenibacillus pabuli TaxID=1472 RepID=UPI003CF62D92
MNNCSILNIKLEEERQKLHNLIEDHGLGHPSVIKQSQHLDGIINEYNNKSKSSRHPAGANA